MTANDDEIGLETPDVDRLEQLQPLVDDPDDLDRGSGLPAGPPPGSMVGDRDADEADVVEQSIGVPADDDYRR